MSKFWGVNIQVMIFLLWHQAGTPLPCLETYMGTDAFSEPETQVNLVQLNQT
jgi:hypothetical protein